jgi:uncharacterized protein (TIGR01619 family)
MMLLAVLKSNRMNMSRSFSYHLNNSKSTLTWDYYYCLVDQKPAIVSVDLNLVDRFPDSSFPTLFYISLGVLSPNDEGFPTSTELVSLCQMEDALLTHLSLGIKSLFAGRVTTNGTRDLIFYTSRVDEMEMMVKTAMKAYPQYSYECGSKEDDEWDFYIDFLFPNERELNAIYNHRYTSDLGKLGDQAHQERTITHTLYFPDETYRDNFILHAIDAFYQVESIQLLPAHEKNRWKTMISRVDSVELIHINQVTLELLDLAIAENGVYEGWVSVPQRISDAV